MTETAPTIYDRLKDVNVEGSNPLIDKKTGKQTAKVLDGMKPRRPSIGEGLHTLTPEELLTIRIPEISYNGRVRGYQRPFKVQHARRAAQALREGKRLPPLLLALTGRGQLEGYDCQHRAAGAVMARMPLDVVVQRLSAEERQQLFTDQRLALKMDPNILVMTGTGPFERYVQEAAVNQSGHPWSKLVSPGGSKTRIGPNQMFALLIRYVANRSGQGAGISNPGAFKDRWDRGLADELAPLIGCFGNRETNPLAFRNRNLMAIGNTAMWVLRRHEPHPEDRERWLAHMPEFQFDMYRYIVTETDMTDTLLKHWNKRLSGKRRVTRD
jgi:hypothetical protein